MGWLPSVQNHRESCLFFLRERERLAVVASLTKNEPLSVCSIVGQRMRRRRSRWHFAGPNTQSETGRMVAGRSEGGGLILVFWLKAPGGCAQRSRVDGCECKHMIACCCC